MAYTLSVKKLVPFLFILFTVFACKKESFTTSSNARLTTNVDTLHFDTVFTSLGSTSRLLKVINDNDKGIHVSSVRLAGGAASPFRINVDGVTGPLVNNIDIGANDSAYVFVTVTINPNAANLAFVVRDSIEINYNGNTKWVQLDAYGQNAHFFRNRMIRANETWIADKPYVILGGLVVDTNATLNVAQSCRIYTHADAAIIVNGSLQVQGDKYDSTRVIFTGDRLDDPYRNYPANWPGIVFTAISKNNSFQYAIIKNAYQALVVNEPASSGAKLTLNESVVDNAYDVGILAINSSINARNVLVSNCGKNVVLAKGGTYNFTHCTVAAFSNSYIQHKDPVLLATNYSVQGGSIFTGNLNASFTNCIFWGDAGFVNDEVATSKQGSGTFNLAFNNVLWRVQTTPANVTTSGNVITNQNPSFDSISVADKFYNFRLKDDSPAINKGSNAGVIIDLDGKPRPFGTLPDLGAYQKR
ncbi:MAG: hypothetical protein C4330_07985 [Chitinophagaceae bacterium]